MNMPNTIARKAMSRRGSMRSSAAALGDAMPALSRPLLMCVAMALGLLPIGSGYLTLVRRAAVLMG